MASESKKVLTDEIRDSAEKIWLAGLGALSSAEDEGVKVFNNLVAKGEAYESRGKEKFGQAFSSVEDAVGKAESSWKRIGEAFDERVAGALERLGVPNRDEINTLTKRVEELTVKIDKMRAGAATKK